MPTPVPPESAKPETPAPKQDAGQTPAIKKDDQPILFSRNKWMKLFNKGEFEALSADFIRVLHHFNNISYTGLSAEKRATINDLVESFLFFFCHPDFKVPVNYTQTFMTQHMNITNIVAMSDYGTTTPWVFRMMLRKENFLKLLVLHNVRSAAPIEPSRIFDVHPFVASEWWAYYWGVNIAFCTKELHERIRAHLSSLDDRFMIFGAGSRGSYFPVTYVAPDLEQLAKERINRLATKAFANVVIRNKPKRNKIAIVTSKWFRSAVYTSLSPLIKSLKERYELTLIHYGMDETILLDRDMFERMICIQLKKDQMNLETLQDNEFSALIYPDVGMHAESIFLSNIRIAPVQICLYGHPSSTWSTQMDYFIGGQKVELLEKAEKDYSERLAVIPGLGVYPVLPRTLYRARGTGFRRPFHHQLRLDMPESDVSPSVRPAGHYQKVEKEDHFPDIRRQCRKRQLFYTFCQGRQFNAGRQACRGDGRHGPQIDYLAALCKGSFSIDAWPFGGFNTVVDALYCKKPVVAWQGDRAFNRFTAATLEMVGMPELIAHSHDEYVEIVSRMINDDDFRKKEIARSRPSI